MHKSNPRLTAYMWGMLLLPAMLGCGGNHQSDDTPQPKNTAPTSSTDISGAGKSGTSGPKNDRSVPQKKTREAEQKRARPQPTKCTIELNIAEEKSITLTGYGASEPEARRATMQAADAIKEQLLLPKLVMPLSKTGDLHMAYGEALQRILPKAPHRGTQHDSFFARYAASEKTTCKAMTFPSNRIPHWRATWTAGNKPVIAKGTSPTAVIEAARATACYGQFADAMVPEFNKIWKKGRPNISTKQLKKLFKRWRENAIQFAECFAQRPSLNPHNGTLSRGVPEPVHCTATLAPVADYWRPRKDTPDRHVTMVAPTIDGARHLVRQEVRHELFNTALGILYSGIASATPDQQAYLVGRTFSQYWTAISKVSTVAIECEYAGAATEIEWIPPKGETETRYCKEKHPWYKAGRALQTHITDDLETAKQILCDPAVTAQLQTVKSITDGSSANKGLSIVEALGQTLMCLSSCRLDTRITFDGSRSKPVPIPQKRLNP